MVGHREGLVTLQLFSGLNLTEDAWVKVKLNILISSRTMPRSVHVGIAPIKNEEEDVKEELHSSQLLRSLMRGLRNWTSRLLKGDELFLLEILCFL